MCSYSFLQEFLSKAQGRKRNKMRGEGQGGELVVVQRSLESFF